MEYLLFVTYLVLVAWLVTKTPFFRRSGLNESQLVIIFLLKVIAGIFYGWIGIYYGGLAKMEDTWSFHSNSLTEYNLLLSDPGQYFKNIFHNPYEGGLGGVFRGNESYWNDLKGNFFIKILSVFNIFSFGHYYSNVIFYSFITLLGPVAFYRVMTDLYPGKKIPVLVACFLVPSFLYWSSGIHKEGLIFTAIAMIFYALYFGLKEKRFTWKKILIMLTGLGLLFILRNFLFVLAVPAVAAWLLASRYPSRALYIFAGMYFAGIVCFFNLRVLDPRLDFPQAVVHKQQEFLQLSPGGSTIPIRELQPHFVSFMKNTPQAITLSVLRPFPKDVKHILSLAASLELNFLLLLFLLSLLYRKSPGPVSLPVLFCIFLAFTILLTIGFTVNNLGAIVRYRSIIIPLLVVPIAASIDWSKIWKQLSNISNNNNV